MTKTFEVNLQHGRLTWDIGASAWLLFWVHQAGTVRTEHQNRIGGSLDDDMPTIGRLVGRAIPRDIGPITGTIYVDGMGGYRGRIEVVASQIDGTWAA